MVSAISGYGSFNASSIAQMRQNAFNAIDQNSDGSIAKTELQALFQQNSSSAETVMAALDTNTDGAISQQEFDASLAKLEQEMRQSLNAAPPPPPPDRATSEDMFSSLDQDGDGYITLAELNSTQTNQGTDDANSILSSMDADADGQISKTEWASAMDNVQSSSAPPPPPPPSDSNDIFSSLDQDGDGQISKTEWDAAMNTIASQTQDSSSTNSTENMFNTESWDFLGRMLYMMASSSIGSDTTSTGSNSYYA